MDKLKKIQENIDQLKTIDNLKDKINKMKEIKLDITNEESKSNKLLEKLNDNKPKKDKKYKKLKLDQIEKIFEEEKDFNEKINIYNHLCYKIDKIEEELFNNDSESEEIDFESDDSS